MWINPYRSVQNLVWRHPWSLDVISELVFSTNLKGTITNSNLKLASLVLHEATILDAVPAAHMAAPNSCLDNMYTVSWSTREALRIKPVVAYLLCIYMLPDIFIKPFGFYHPRKENCMSDDASHIFYLFDTLYLYHMFVAYSQLLSLWHIYPPSTELLSCVISMLHSKPYEQALLRMRISRGCTGSRLIKNMRKQYPKLGFKFITSLDVVLLMV